MELDSIQSSLNPHIHHFYNLKLSQSIQSLLSQLDTQNTQSTQFLQDFYEFIQAQVDPPLESIWVYASIAFRTQNAPKKDHLLDRISSVKRLLQLIQLCSSSCGSSKSVALLCPVVYEVHNVVVELFGNKDSLSSKRESKAVREVRSLVEAILGYVNVCSSKGFSDEADSGMVSGFSNLVRIWAGSSLALESFLPLVSGEVCGRVGGESCEVGYLASAVVFEAFLLKLWLSFGNGVSNEDLVKELRTWAVGSITGFRNFYFFEILARMLLEKTLPSSLVLSSTDEVLLRKVLYDAVILVDYSFLNLEKTSHLPADRLRNLAIARLVVAHEGVVYFRERGDRKKSISYINAFCNSSLASQIVRWIKNHVHVKDNDCKSHGSSPTALIKWLVNLQEQGVQIFDDSLLKARAELARDTFVTDLKQPPLTLESMKVDDDILFFVDNKGEEFDADEAMTAAFVAAAHSMNASDDGGKKRKREKNAKKKKVKFVTYEAPTGRSSGVTYRSDNSGNEVENPVSESDNDTN